MKRMIVFSALSLVATAVSAQPLPPSVGGGPHFVNVGLSSLTGATASETKVQSNTIVCFERKADHHAVCKRMAEWRRLEAELEASKAAD